MPLPIVLLEGWVLKAIIVSLLAIFTYTVIKEILNWFREKTTSKSKYGELIKKKLASGDYRLISGVFNKHGVKTASKKWKADKDDPGLKKLMGRRMRIRLKLEDL